MASRQAGGPPQTAATPIITSPAAPALADISRDEIEAVARIGSYATDLVAGHWASSKGLDAIFGIDASFDRSVAGWLSLVHPADREEMAAYLADEVVGQGLPFDRRYRIVRAAGGEERWVHGRGSLEFDAAGRPVRLIGTIADVTDQHLTHEALVASERRYAAILEGTAEAILIADAATYRYRWVNPAATVLLGYTRDELLRMRVRDLHPREALPGILAGFRTVADGQITEARAVPCLRRDGSVLLADIRSSTATVDGVPCNIAFFTDVTELVAAQEQRARLAAAVEQASDSVLITDLAGAIEYVNPAFEVASGYRREEVLGQNPRILKSGRQSDAFYRALWHRLTGGSSWTGRFVNRRADGALYQVEATISPIRGVRGDISGYIGVQRDVTALQAARSSLANEFRERAQVAAALARLQPGPSAAQTAADICAELSGLPGVDVAAILNFPDPGHASALGVVGPDGIPVAPGRALPPSRAAYLYERASLGPWAEAYRPRRIDGEYGRAMAAIGVRAFAYAPIRNGEGLLGLVAAGTRDEAYARHLVDHLPAVGEFAATASALLARDLEGDHRLTRLRRQIAGIIADRAFHPVFQPIVDVQEGRVVGYEALTRFADGTRPDHRFADAWAAGLGADLELAALDAAIATARSLPGGRWLDVNVSPQLLDDPDRVRGALAKADRPVIVEITEHDTVADYRALREAIRSLGSSVRTAVDDAGAGIANFGHIVELRPDFVKLDIGLVRGVNADLGRQAMMIAMRHFAKTVGCRLIGEGVETEAEARSLAMLGVDFAQGYLYGRPDEVSAFAEDRHQARGSGGSARRP